MELSKIIRNIDAAFESGCMRYDPETGVFFKRSSRINAETQTNYRKVGSIDRTKYGYVMVSINGAVVVKGHRLAVYLMTGQFPPDNLVVDHINGDASDNRWINLRVTTREENSQNRTKRYTKTTSGLLGVEKREMAGLRTVYRAKLMAKGISHNLGTFQTPEEAHAAYLSAKRRLHSGCTI